MLPSWSGYRSCYLRQWPSRWQLKFIIFSTFFCLLLFEAVFTSFFKDKKVIKMPQNSRNQRFSYYFCLMMEGSWAWAGAGSVLMTNGSGCQKQLYFASNSRQNCCILNGLLLTHFESVFFIFYCFCFLRASVADWASWIRIWFY